MLKEGLLIDTTINPHYFSSDSTFKGIVQRDVRGVESRLKRSALRVGSNDPH